MIFIGTYGTTMNMDKVEKKCRGAIALGEGYVEDFEIGTDGKTETLKESKGKRVPVIIWAMDSADVEKLKDMIGFMKSYTNKFINVKIGSSEKEVLTFIAG